jgi:hypothetical protein
MNALIRFLPIAAGLALLAACGGPTASDNLADLDAKLTNGADNGVDAANEAIALAAAGGKIEKAPGAIATKNAKPQGQALNDLSGRAGGPQGDCAKNVKIGPEWADRMPHPFRLYPGAKLVEAGGIDKERCTLRIISFTTPAAVEPVLDYYYTQAKRAGYDAEHLLSQNEHQLGGTRKDGGAYVVFARATPGKPTEVNIVANAD